ncbi:MAG: T9SS type A sorting domain-containing protein [Schleiferiaceae bacterium]|nr:T9SS type A sorting domain-containing protein [Schleiferiaceae bacterium]
MKKYLPFLLSFCFVSTPLTAQLSLRGILDLDLPSAGAAGKAIHVHADSAISDLSRYGIGVANNGGGSDGLEYVFPAISLQAGDDVLIARDSSAMSSYFAGCFSQFEFVLTANNSISQNGDDAIELYKDSSVVEVFGDVNVDGSGTFWEYSDSWAFKDTLGLTWPNGWIYGGVGCTVGDSLVSASLCPYPECLNVLLLHDVTFRVDMNEYAGSFTTPEVNGTFNGWCGNCAAMTDSDGDNVWEITLALEDGVGVEYKFSYDNWTGQEANDPASPCTNGNSTFTNRVLTPASDTVLAPVCWGSCDECSGIGLLDSELGLKVYPNPANSYTILFTTLQSASYSLLNAMGQTIHGGTIHYGENFVDFTRLTPGLYFIEVKSNEYSEILKVIRQ